MRVYLYAKFAAGLFAGALILPAASLTHARPCSAGEPTPESYTWNFHQEAQELLGDIAAEAGQAEFHSDQLEHFSPSIDWEEHADELRAIRTEINDMGNQLCRLETIRRVASPWEQKAIDDAAPLIAEMASEARSAIQFLNEKQDDLFTPSYHALSVELYEQSSELKRTVNQFENFSKIHQQDIRLEKSLGLIKKS